MEAKLLKLEEELMNQKEGRKEMQEEIDSLRKEFCLYHQEVEEHQKGLEDELYELEEELTNAKETSKELEVELKKEKETSKELEEKLTKKSNNFNIRDDGTNFFFPMIPRKKKSRTYCIENNGCIATILEDGTVIECKSLHDE